MSDPFDDAKDALSGAEPTTDLWAEANRRAASGDVVELAPVAPPRRGRWLAVAAAVALVAGTVGVLSLGDDSTVDTTPSDPSDEPTIYQGEGGCSFGITGEPLTPREFGPAEDPVPGTHFVIGGLTARVNVPSGSDFVFEGAPWVPVTLRRGEAKQTSPGERSTRIAWLSGGGSSCDTFSVSVSGGDTDVTEPAAIALADRIVLQSELVDDRDPTLFQLGECAFGVTGAPVVEATDGDQAPRLDGQPSIRLGLGTSQNALVHVPGYVVDDLIGERVEEVELARGTASVWFTPDFVQVRWFPGSQEPCDSFAVTVAGSTEDGNRHAAVDLADRILLPAEIDVEEPAVASDDLLGSLEGEWQLALSTINGQPTDGSGLTFSFLDGDGSWTDGCNSFGGRYEAIDDRTVSFGDIGSTELPCPTNPTSQAVQAVMGAPEIEARLGAAGTDTLSLAAGDVVLLLRAAESPATVAPVRHLSLLARRHELGGLGIRSGWPGRGRSRAAVDDLVRAPTHDR